MATIGVMTTEFDFESLELVADQIARHRIEVVQLQLGSALPAVSTRDALLRGLDVLGPYLSESLATRSRELLGARGISIGAVDGTYNMIHPDPHRRARNLEHLISLIKLAPLFGTDVVTLC